MSNKAIKNMVTKKQPWFTPLMGWPTFKLREGVAAKIAACALVMSLAACGNNDDPNGEKGKDEVESGIKVTLRENFKGNPQKDINNIQMYDFVRYDLEVTGTGNPKEYEYWFNPRSNSGVHHQRLWKDYRAWLFNDANYKIYMNPQTPMDKCEKIMEESALREEDMPIQPNKKYILLIQPSVAGTFQLSPECSRRKRGDPRTDIAETHINFNCTSIEAWWIDKEDRPGGLFQESRSHNEFFFLVDDGDAETDKYLTKKKDRKITYEVKYNNETYRGDFFEGKPIWFHNSDSKRGAPPVNNRTISSIKLLITEVGQEQIEIVYYNIHIYKKNNKQ